MIAHRTISREFRVALPWELFCVDNLVVITETEDDLIKKLNEWKHNVENGDMKVNMNKTKVMINGECQKLMQKAARRPCDVCGRGDDSNSTQCTSCQKWVHKMCNGIKGQLVHYLPTWICH